MTLEKQLIRVVVVCVVVGGLLLSLLCRVEAFVIAPPLGAATKKWDSNNSLLWRRSSLCLNVPRDEFYLDEEDDDEFYLDEEYGEDSPRWIRVLDSRVLFPACGEPRAFVHFVGGTWAGSYPLHFYSTLLEAVSSRCGVAVIATPIPIRPPPLRHDRLARRLRRQFRRVYSLLSNNSNRRTPMPVLAIGHSLGARLLAILSTTHTPTTTANILLAFNNYNASDSVPGIRTLNKTIRRLHPSDEQDQRHSHHGQQQRHQDDDYHIDLEDDDLEDDPTNNHRFEWQHDMDYSDDEDEYDDIDDISFSSREYEEEEEFSSLVTTVRSHLSSVLSSRRRLEFRPSPEELWHRLERRYGVVHTLVVQFHEDDIDQSAPLAKCLLASSGRNVKFARLSGSHQTPVSDHHEWLLPMVWNRRPPVSSFLSSKEDPPLHDNRQYSWKKDTSSGGKEKRMTDRGKGTELQDLIGSIVHYIDNVLPQ